MSDESFAGAVASSAGDDFHERWVARELLRLLDPDSEVSEIRVEGLPRDEFHEDLGAHAQAVDVALIWERGDDRSYRYLQMKYSASNPDQAWTWARLTSRKRGRGPEQSVLGKLAALMDAIFFEGSFAIVTNQPAAAEVADDIALLLAEEGNEAARARKRRDLSRRLGLAEQNLVPFLRRWDLTGFQSISRLRMETDIMSALAAASDADARSDADLLQQRVAQLMLPENRNHPPITRETLLLWLGVGTEEALFPAPSRIRPASPYLRRGLTDQLVAALKAPQVIPLRLHAAGGCGKTSLITALAGELPTGSELFIYDCYGGGLFLASDQRRHLAETAFVQLGNELAARLRSPLVLRRASSRSPVNAFLARVRAAADFVASRDPDALLVIAFDAVDNARIASEHWQEKCFLDELSAVSSWPGNVRTLVSCRSSRLEDVGAASLYSDYSIPAFDPAEVLDLIALVQPAWDLGIAEEMHDLTSGNPRRLVYAMEGLGAGDASQAIIRLLPRGMGIDPLFEKRVTEAGGRLGNVDLVWRVLCVLARLPRPIPARIIERLCGLKAGEVADIATDLGGMVEHKSGWSFHDEDFEAFARDRTTGCAEQILEEAAALLMEQRGVDDYAAKAVGEALVAADRRADLYELVTSQAPEPIQLGRVDAHFVRAGRLALALRCAREAADIPAACRLLIAAAEAKKQASLLETLMVDNIDLATRFASEHAMRLIMVGQRHAAKRARLRIALARASLPADEPAARLHMRWWDQYLTHARDDEQRQEIGHGAVADDFLVARHFAGDESALKRLMGWCPNSARSGAFQLLTMLAGGDRASLVRCAIAHRRWPPRTLVLLVAAGLLAGIDIEDPEVVAALETLSKARPRHWSNPEYRVEKRPVIGWEESLLLICERAAARPGLAPLLRALLGNIPERPGLSRVNDLAALQSRIEFHARLLTLREHLDHVAVVPADWLPARKELPPPDPRRRNDLPREKSPEERWNEAVAETTQALEGSLAAARATLSLVTGALAPDEAWSAISRALDRSGSFGGSARGSESAYLLIRAQLLHHALAGKEVSSRFESVRRIMKSWDAGGTPLMMNLASSLALVDRAQGAVLELLASLDQGICEEAGAGSHKAKEQAVLARIALPLDPNLARSLFDAAIESTGKVDFEAIRTINTCGALAIAGLSGSRTERAMLAERIGESASGVVESLGLRGDFAWRDAVQWIAAADLPTGLAAAARWHDRGTATFDNTLPYLLPSFVSSGLSPAQKIALTLLCGPSVPGLNELELKPDETPKSMIEDVLFDRLLDGDATQFLDAYHDAKPCLASSGSPVLERAGDLRDRLLAWRGTPEAQSEAESNASKAGEAGGPPLRNVESIAAELDAFCADRAYHRSANVLAAMATRVASPALRVPFLEEARHKCRRSDTVRAFGRALIDILMRWRSYPPVRDWEAQRLPEFIADFITDLDSGYSLDDEPLEKLLAATGRDDQAQVDLLLEGIERNAETIHPDLLFRLVGLIAGHTLEANRNALLAELLDRLGARMTRPASVPMIGVSAPEEVAESVGRLLFTAMGDIDVGVRWRAAHAGLRLLRIGDPAGRALAACIASIRAPSFALPPVYYYAAAEQLMILLQRAALDRPDLVAEQAPAILARLREDPHVNIREIGRALLLDLDRRGVIALDPNDRAWLDALNRSPFPKVKPAKLSMRRRGWQHERKKRTWDFDETDTIPYWYSPVMDLFELPDGGFLDRVEGWIHGRWGFDNSGRAWLAEPRLERLRRVEGRTSHRHGSHPQYERLNLYLEWHGMLCALGELIETQPIIDHEYGESLDDWLPRNLVTLPPHWLSDLRTPPPFEKRFWGHRPTFAESEDDDARLWNRSVGPKLFEEEIRTETGELVIAADFMLNFDRRRQQVDVSCALVSPETAASLGQALLTAKNHMDFILPRSDDDNIDHGEFKLERWLSERHDDPRADRHDDRRGTVSRIPVRPVASADPGLAALHFDVSQSAWLDPSGKADITLAQWGADDEHGNSYGWRATASKTFLTDLLQRTGRSMIFLVEIRRSTRRSSDDRPRWSLFVLDARGGLRRIERTKPAFGADLVRSEKLDNTCNTLARWMLHRIGELEALAATEPRRGTKIAKERERLRAMFAAIKHR